MSQAEERANGTATALDPVVLRAMEAEILDGPIPVIDPEDESRLLREDPGLAEAMNELQCSTELCSQDALCNNCKSRRRYVALQLHRRRHGRAPHPSEVAQDGDEHPDQTGDAYEGNGVHRAERGPADDGEPWEAIIPLGQVPAVSSFPVDVLPPALAAFVADAAAALACPPGYLGLPILATAGAAIGGSRALQVKAKYTERPCLYAAVIGPPGSAKTPALKLVAHPIYAEQARLIDIYKRAKRAQIDGASTEEPKLSSRWVGDITTEKLADVLQDNPRGVAMIRDELSSWVSGMDQYKARGRGSDRQFFLAAWAGEPVRVDRKNQEHGPVFVAHPFVAVVGGMPPGLLTRLRGERGIADGFLDRLLFDFPEPSPAVGETWAAVSDEAAESWARTLAALYELQPEDDGAGNHRPRCVRLTSDGRRSWERFTAALAADMNREDFPDCLRGPWSKLRAYGARLALILHCLRQAVGERVDEDVDGDSMDRGAEFVTYFQGHARKVYSAMDADQDVEKARRLLEWIERRKPDRFKPWEPFDSMKNQSQFPKVESLDAPLARLEKHHYIRSVNTAQEAGQRGPGRPPSALYEVNPSVWDHPVNPVNPGNC
jgi:hypothetical protein